MTSNCEHKHVEYIGNPDNCWYYNTEPEDLSCTEPIYCPDCGKKLEKPDGAVNIIRDRATDID